MQLFPHWARVRLDLRGEPDPSGAAIAFGWSATSLEEARVHATERATRIAERLREGPPARLRDAWEYYPTERPLRELLVERIEDRGALVAAITRNAYGAYVLNTAAALFVDVDVPTPPPAPGFFARLFGAAPAPAPDPMERIREVLSKHPGIGMRWYRTHSGYRGLVTSRTLDPAGDEAVALMQELGADPLYVSLCTRQECARARLSPKPWRIGMGQPQTHWFPFQDDPPRERRFRAWDTSYERAREGWSVCAPLAAIGPEAVDPAIAPILALHDRWCCTGHELA